MATDEAGGVGRSHHQELVRCLKNYYLYPRSERKPKNGLNDGVAQHNFSFYRLHCLHCEVKTGGRKSERGIGITPVCCPWLSFSVYKSPKFLQVMSPVTFLAL